MDRGAVASLWRLWLVSALKRKKAKQRETILQRFGYTLPLWLAFYLLYQAHPLYGWLRVRFLPVGPAGEWLGVVLTAGGIAVASWARWHLGTNWSGVVALKQGHELIRTGPYRTIRHPIYTGILLALLGTALSFGELRALLAVAIAWSSFYIKARREELFPHQAVSRGQRTSCWEVQARRGMRVQETRRRTGGRRYQAQIGEPSGAHHSERSAWITSTLAARAAGTAEANTAAARSTNAETITGKTPGIFISRK
jgi:protein-S-isoprenylcysteine O-methyltransferase Ste14